MEGGRRESHGRAGGKTTMNVHPLLKKLKLDDDDPAVSPLQILNHLLQNGTVTTNDVQFAVDALALTSSLTLASELVPAAASASASGEHQVAASAASEGGVQRLPSSLADPTGNMGANSGTAAAAARTSNATTTTTKTTTTTTITTTTTTVITTPTVKQIVRRRPIALRIYYDGAKYSGLAQNLGQDDDNSVEKALFRALLKTRLIESRKTSGYSRCGRTDKGVSAAGQVVAFQLKSSIPLDASTDEAGLDILTDDDLPKNSHDSIRAWVTPRSKKKNETKPNSKSQQGPIETASMSNDDATAKATAPPHPPPQRHRRELNEYSYASMLNSLLPDDIRVLGWCPVSQDFSARFSATTRTYRYFFLKRQMDLGLIRQGLSNLVGRHDFRNFCKMDVEKVYNFERLIHSADVVEIDGNDDDSGSIGTCFLQIVGQAFLWHQIRCIAHVIFLVGKGLELPSIVADLLDVDMYPGKPSYALAPERPLVLHECGYPNLRFGHSAKNLWMISCHLETQWEETVLAAARIRNRIGLLAELPILKQDCIDFATMKCNERAKKKSRHYGPAADGNGQSVDEVFNNHDVLGHGDSSIATISWGECLPWLAKCGLVPDPDGLLKSIHIPLQHRSRGTTYEQKVQALKQNDKRRQKYTDNVIKKRKTAEEDAEFYRHMTQQGGAGM